MMFDDIDCRNEIKPDMMENCLLYEKQNLHTLFFIIIASHRNETKFALAWNLIIEEKYHIRPLKFFYGLNLLGRERLWR